MPVVGNRIKVASSSTGTGNITLGSAEDGFQSFADGGISNNDVVRYVITEGSSWEIGKGTYLTSGPTLTRTSGNLLESSTGSLLNLGGSATVFVSLADVDVMQTDGGTFSGAVTFTTNTDLDGITAGNQTIYRGNGALKLIGGGVQSSRNLVNLSNSAGATIYGGSASTNATLRSTYGVTIDGGDGDVTLDSDITFTGASYNVTWDKSADDFVFDQGAKLDFGGGANIHRDTGGIFRVTGSTASDTYFNFNNNLIFYRGGYAAAQLMYSDSSQRFHAYGNITVGGTVDGRDVATDGTKLDTIATSATANPNAIDNVVEDTTPQLGGDLASNGNDILFADNDKAIFGAGSDLQIYHDGSNSYVQDAGTGILAIKGNQINVNSTTDAAMATFIETGAATLYHNGSAKIATTSTGVSVTGDMLASGKIGLDSTDYVTFTNNTQMDVYINGSNEFRFEADGDFHADGNVIAYSTTIASDASLKENIQPVTGLQSVMALNGVSFDWKRDGKKSAGVIAQQVQKIMPEAVTEVKAMDGSKHLSVNYNALTSVLIEAIKDLKTEIEELKNGSHN